MDLPGWKIKAHLAANQTLQLIQHDKPPLDGSFF
jgi:hypothetical protein